MFEGTGKYFLILFMVFFIVYITVKICLGKLFKEAKLPVWKAYVPFYNRLVLTNLLDLKKGVFYKTLIPIGNLYYYNIIIKELLKAYKLNPKESIWFIIIPMYKFPELVFKHPKFMLHMYDETEEFINNQNVLFETNPQKTIQAPEPQIEFAKNYKTNQASPQLSVTQNDGIINKESNNQMRDSISEEPQIYIYNSQSDDNIFLNKSLEPDNRQETIIEAKKQEVKQEKPIIADNSKPKVCPNCGTKLSPTATTCFLCGTKLL